MAFGSSAPRWDYTWLVVECGARPSPYQQQYTLGCSWVAGRARPSGTNRSVKAAFRITTDYTRRPTVLRALQLSSVFSIVFVGKCLESASNTVTSVS
jgi:hypothetical protein